MYAQTQSRHSSAARGVGTSGMQCLPHSSSTLGLGQVVITANICTTELQILYSSSGLAVCNPSSCPAAFSEGSRPRGYVGDVHPQHMARSQEKGNPGGINDLPQCIWLIAAIETRNGSYFLCSQTFTGLCHHCRLLSKRTATSPTQHATEQKYSTPDALRHGDI